MFAHSFFAIFITSLNAIPGVCFSNWFFLYWVKITKPNGLVIGGLPLLVDLISDGAEDVIWL
jgi:hypothetical protein